MYKRVILCILLFIFIHYSCINITYANVKYNNYIYTHLGNESNRVAIINGNPQYLLQYDCDGYDLRLLAEVMYHENGMNGRECMYLTGAVVINRVKHKRYPNTIKEVLYQKGQYATTGKFFTKTIPTEVYEIARELLLYRAYDVPKNVIFQSMHPYLGSGIYKSIPSSYAPTKDIEYFCYEWKEGNYE